MTLNKFEKFILDRIGLERGRKWLFKIEALVHKYKDYRIRKELDAKRDAAILTFPESHRKMAKTLLDNQISSLLSANRSANPPTTEQMHMVMDSAIKTIGAYKLLSDIVGVQPMSGPTDLVFILQCAENEGMSLNLNSVPSKATSSKFQASMPLEPIRDTSNRYGFDIQRELAKALGSVFGSEIVSDTIRNLVSIAAETKVNYSPTDDADVAKLAFIEFNKAASDIALKTRRGVGNFLIMSPDTFAEIAMTPSVPWEPASDVEPLDVYGLAYAGKLGEKYSIYLSTDPTFVTGKVLVGYAGVSRSPQMPETSVDVGVTLTPYIPVVSTGVMVDSNTYEPVVGFLNRSGTVYNDLKSEKFEQKAANYYQMVDISSLLAH